MAGARRRWVASSARLQNVVSGYEASRIPQRASDAPRFVPDHEGVRRLARKGVTHNVLTEFVSSLGLDLTDTGATAKSDRHIKLNARDIHRHLIA